MNAEQLLQHFERISEAPDAIPRLRRFILDLAVRGKLVEQDPSDEPAAELLKRIAAEKVRLNRKERSKRDPTTLNGDSEPLQVPNGWALAPLADLVTVLNGRAYKQQELLSAGTPVLRVGNLFTSDRWYYSTLELDADKYCEKGDLIFAWSASFGPFIWVGLKVIYHYHIWKLPLHSESDLSKLYLYNFLLQKTREIKEAGHGISMIHMTKEKMELLQVPLPPLAEQHRIVARVDELMSLCDQLEGAKAEREQCRDSLVAASLQGLNQPAEEEETFREHARFTFGNLPRITTRAAHIKQLRQTILNLAVRGKLVPQVPGDEPAAELLAMFTAAKSRNRKGRNWSPKTALKPEQTFETPAGWAWATIDETAERVTVGYVGPMKEQYVNDGVPFLRSQNVRANKFREDGLVYISPGFHEKIIKSAIAPGDVVVVRSGNVGTACVIPPSIKQGNCSDLVVIQSLVCLVPEFLCFFLNSLASVHVEAGSVGVALTHFNTKSVATMPIPLPPLAEQHRIVAKVDQLMAICNQLEAQIKVTEQDSCRFLEAVLSEALSPALVEAA